MRIEKIEIKGLFGIFDHDIPLNQDKRLTILYGPNGVGKTKTLELINNVFRGRYFEIAKTPLKELRISFSNSSFLKLLPETPGDRQTSLIDDDSFSEEEIIKYKDLFIVNEKGDKFSLGINKVISSGMIADIAESSERLKRVGARRWIDRNTGEFLSQSDIIDRYADYLPEFEYHAPKWIANYTDQFDVNLINTTRLLNLGLNGSDSKIRRFRPNEKRYAVEEYSEDLARRISMVQSDYADKSQELDRTFPTRLLNGNSINQVDSKDLDKRMQELNDKRDLLINAGLIDGKATQFDIKDFKNTNPSDINVLSVYIDDIENKFEVFDDTLERINTFKDSINSRFRYKKMVIDRKRGFYFLSNNNTKLPLSKLSSGEQHEIVLFYNLLFRVKENAIILIDEPEISLHVSWQNKFLDDILKIIEINHFDVIVATHSPDIIQDKMDLAVELKGPENESSHNA